MTQWLKVNRHLHKLGLIRSYLFVFSDPLLTSLDCFTRGSREISWTGCKLHGHLSLKPDWLPDPRAQDFLKLEGLFRCLKTTKNILGDINMYVDLIPLLKSLLILNIMVSLNLSSYCLPSEYKILQLKKSRESTGEKAYQWPTYLDSVVL